MEFRPCIDRVASLELEAELIAQFKPRYNFNPGYKGPKLRPINSEPYSPLIRATAHVRVDWSKASKPDDQCLDVGRVLYEVDANTLFVEFPANHGVKIGVSIPKSAVID